MKFGSADRKVLGLPEVGKKFVSVSSGNGIQGWIRKDLPEGLLGDFLAAPERFLDVPSSQVLKDEPKIKVVRRNFKIFGGPELSIVIKCFRYPSLFRRLGFLFAQSPATRSLRGSLLLERYRVATALPIAALEERSWKKLGTSYYFAQEITDGYSLPALWRDVLPTLDRREASRISRMVLMEIASLWHQLHSLGIYHSDLKGSNVMVRRSEGSRWESFLVDVDRVRKSRRMGWKKRVKNLVQFYSTLGKRLDAREKNYFFKRYADLSSLSRAERRSLHKILLESETGERSPLPAVGKRAGPERRKVPVVFVLGGLPYGGIENLFLDLLANLDKNRLDYKLINLSGKGVLTEKFLKSGIELINMGFSLSTHRLDNTWRLRRLLIKLKPDAIFTSHFSANYHARLASMGLGIKVITQVHNTKRERYWERRLADRFLGLAATSRFIAVSRKVQEALEIAVPASVGKTTLFYNAVAEERLKLPEGYSRDAFRRREGILPEHFLVAAVGRLVYQKGLDILLPAFKRVAAAVPEARLLIAGDGEMQQHLTAMAEALSVGEKVRFLGYRQDIPAILAASDVFVMPSRWEGFSIVALEAMAMGAPTVMTDTSPNSEVVSHGETAWIVGCDPEAIAEGILTLYRNPELRVKLARNEKELFGREFSVHGYARKIEELILEAVQS
jgi:glycosyltransferase involved in cell wall biosynthesis